jgi:hypothetical protein
MLIATYRRKSAVLAALVQLIFLDTEYSAHLTERMWLEDKIFKEAWTDFFS